MPDTIRQQIVDAIEARLKDIKVVNGYSSDLGDSIHEWRSVPLSTAELPALIWRDLDEPLEEHPPNADRWKRSLHFQVEIVAAGTASAKDYRKLLADVEKAFKSGRLEDGSWWAGASGEGLAFNMRPRISRLVVEQESSKIAGGFFECFIDYWTRDFDSYE